MSKNLFDPLSALGRIRDIHDQLGVTRQMRWLDDVRWNRAASALGSDYLAGEAARRLMAPQMEATQRLGANPTIQQALNYTRAFDQSFFQRVADSVSVREMFSASRLLSERFPNRWDRVLDTRALTSYAEEQLSGAASLRTSQAAYGIPESIRVAQQLAAQVEAYLPKNYARQFKRVAGGIDFEVIRSAAMAASARVRDDLWLDDSPDLDDVYDAVEGANLEDVRAVVEEALTAAFQDAAEKGLLSGGPSQWLQFFLTIFVSVLLAAGQIIGQPIFQHWYEAADDHAPPKSTSAAKIDHMASSRSTNVNARINLSAPAASPNVTLVSVTTMRLFLGPDTKQRVVGTVPAGHILRKRRSQRGWVLVMYVDPRGDGASLTGWVRAKYVRSVEAATRRIIMCAFDAARSDDSCDE